MIYTKITNIDSYSSLHPRFKDAFAALKEYALADTPTGKYFIGGDNLFVNVQAYDTEDGDKFEQHHKYIDIQYVISGCEDIKAVNIDDAILTDEYSDSEDCAFYRPAAGVATFEMTAGDALILFPDDPHCPGLPHGAPSHVQKAIVKVRID